MSETNFVFPAVDNKGIADRLKCFRTHKKFSVKYVAELLFITPQAVYSWEYGKTTPDVLNVAALSRLYGVSTDEIIFGPGEAVNGVFTEVRIAA